MMTSGREETPLFTATNQQTSARRILKVAGVTVVHIVKVIKKVEMKLTQVT